VNVSSRSDPPDAERERRARVVETADEIFTREGEAGLQMKDLARQAGVALATLYRYFPSKDHVLGAVALERHRRVQRRLDTRRFEGETAGERAADMMIREFRAMQREPEIAAALERVTNRPDRSTSEFVEGIKAITEQQAIAAIEQGGTPASAEQLQLLPIFLAASSGAVNHWLSGLLSAEETRAQITVAARLLDLPAEVVRRHLVSARAEGSDT
jgi:TetR/AcrR family transcriptional regulator, cholesterol catabolism regulator